MGYRKQVILKNFLIVFKTIKIIDTQLILLAILKWHSWLSNRINRLNKWINIGTNIFVVFITPFWNLRGKLKSSQILTDVNKMELPGWFWWQKIDLSSKSSKGQIISKGLLDVLKFSQKTNERIRRSSKNEFVRSFFGRIRGYQKSFRNYLTFKLLPTYSHKNSKLSF